MAFSESVRASQEEVRLAILRRRKIFRAKGSGPRWTNIEPALHGVLVASSSKPPPLGVGKLYTRLSRMHSALGANIASRTIKSIAASCISIPAYLVIVGAQRGLLDMINEASLRLAALYAGLIAAAVTFTGDFLFSLLRAARGGVWYGPKYVLDEAQNIGSFHVTSDDNDKAFPIRVPSALPGAYVKVRVEVDRKDQRVKAQLNLAPGAPLDWDSLPAVNREFGVTLSKGPLYLLVRAAPEATATTIRLSLLSFTYSRNIEPKHT